MSYVNPKDYLVNTFYMKTILQILKTLTALKRVLFVLTNIEG